MRDPLRFSGRRSSLGADPAGLHRRLTEALGDIADRYEIILVEDGGGRWVVGRYQRAGGTGSPRSRYWMSRNMDSTTPRYVGSKGEYGVIVTLDDDLQNHQEIGKLITVLMRALTLSRDADERTTWLSGIRVHGYGWRCRAPWGPRQPAT